jgi:hypothetical protein
MSIIYIHAQIVNVLPLNVLSRIPVSCSILTSPKVFLEAPDGSSKKPTSPAYDNDSNWVPETYH